MKLIVGLGNIGEEYENTKHNMGFILLDEIASINNVKVDKERFGGKYKEFIYNGEKVILLKPQHYINLSGEVLVKFINYFKINIEDILVISDDLDMPFGKVKLKSSGSSGGHNGLKNIELHLNTNNYKRIKIGISNNKNIDTKDYVLSKFNNEQLNIIAKIKPLICNIFNDYMIYNFDYLMNKYNRK